MTIFRPPPQGTAYAQPDDKFTIQHRLKEGDCAVCPDGRYIDKTNCIMGPGVIEYTLVPGNCKIAIIEGCTRSTYAREMP